MDEGELYLLLYEWAVGHISQAELARRLGEVKVEKLTIAQHYTAERRTDAGLPPQDEQEPPT